MNTAPKRTVEYKCRSGIGTDKRFLRAYKKNIDRKNVRDEELCKRRGINLSPLKELNVSHSPISEKKMENMIVNSQREVLLKWKRERELKKKQEALNKKKAFKVGVFIPDKAVFLGSSNTLSKTVNTLERSQLTKPSKTNKIGKTNAKKPNLELPVTVEKNFNSKSGSVSHGDSIIQPSLALNNFTFKMDNLFSFNATSSDSSREKFHCNDKSSSLQADQTSVIMEDDSTLPISHVVNSVEDVKDETKVSDVIEHVKVENINNLHDMEASFHNGFSHKDVLEKRREVQNVLDLQQSQREMENEKIENITIPCFAENKIIKCIQYSDSKKNKTPDEKTKELQYPIEGSPWITVRRSTSSKRKIQPSSSLSNTSYPHLVWDENDNCHSKQEEVTDMSTNKIFENRSTQKNVPEVEEKLESQQVYEKLDILEKQEEFSVNYFRTLLKSETDRLSGFCSEWETIYKNTPDLEDDTIGEIRSVIGQAQLLMDQRFEQFSNLIDNCEFKIGEKETTCTDLQGFWEMVYFQVKDVDSKFKNLQCMHENNWKPLEVSRIKTKKASKKKISQQHAAPKTRSQDHVLAARKRLAKAKAALAIVHQDNELQTITRKSKRSTRKSQIDMESFDDGFSTINSSFKSPVSLCKGTKAALAVVHQDKELQTSTTKSKRSTRKSHIGTKSFDDGYSTINSSFNSPVSHCKDQNKTPSRFTRSSLATSGTPVVKSSFPHLKGISCDLNPLVQIAATAKNSVNNIPTTTLTKEQKENFGLQTLHHDSILESLDSANFVDTENIDQIKTPRRFTRSSLASSEKRSCFLKRRACDSIVPTPTSFKVIKKSPSVFLDEKQMEQSESSGINSQKDSTFYDFNQIKNIEVEDADKLMEPPKSCDPILKLSNRTAKSALKSDRRRSKRKLYSSFEENYNIIEEEQIIESTSSKDILDDNFNSPQEFIGHFSRLKVNYTPGMEKKPSDIQLSLLFTPVNNNKRTPIMGTTNDLITFTPELAESRQKSGSRLETPVHKSFRRRSIRLAIKKSGGGSLILS